LLKFRLYSLVIQTTSHFETPSHRPMIQTASPYTTPSTPKPHCQPRGVSAHAMRTYMTISHLPLPPQIRIRLKHSFAQVRAHYVMTFEITTMRVRVMCSAVINVLLINDNSLIIPPNITISSTNTQILEQAFPSISVGGVLLLPYRIHRLWHVAPQIANYVKLCHIMTCYCHNSWGNLVLYM